MLMRKSFVLGLTILQIVLWSCDKHTPLTLRKFQIIATHRSKLSINEIQDLIDYFDVSKQTLKDQIIVDEKSILNDLTFFSPKDSIILNQIEQKKDFGESLICEFVSSNETNLYGLCRKLLNETIRLRYIGAADSMLSKVDTALNWTVTELNKLSEQVFLNNQLKFYQKFSPVNYENKLLLEYFRANSIGWNLENEPARTSLFIAKGLVLAKELNDTKVTMDFYRSIQYLLYRHYGFNALALAFGEHILSQARVNKYYYLEAYTYYYNGEAYLFRGEYTKASEHYNKALKIFLAHNHPFMASSMKERIALIYRHLGKFDKALAQYNSLLSQDDSDFYKMLYLYGIGMVYMEMGEFARAEKFLEQALTLCRKVKDLSNKVVFLGDLADLNLKIGDEIRAKELLAEALNVEENKVAPLSMTTARQKLGKFYLERGDYYTAEANLLKASTLSSKHRFGFLAAQNDLLLAKLNSKKNKPQSALSFVKQSISKFDSIGDMSGNIEALTLAGEIHRLLQEYELAEEKLLVAQQLSEDLPQYANDWEINFNLARLNIDRSEGEIAEEFLEQAIEHIETLTTRVTDYEKRVSFAHKIQTPFEEMVLLQLRQGNKKAAFAYSDNSRAQVLKLLIEENKNESKFATAGFSHLMTDEKPTLEKLQARLGEKSAVLEYEITANEMIIWCIRKNKLDVRSVALTRAMADSVLMAFKDEMELKKVATEKRARASFKNVKPTCRFLYDTLIAPVDSFIKNIEMLYIIPDENLHHLPFAALMDTDSTFLIQQVKLANAASAKTLLLSLEKSDMAFIGSEKSLLAVSVDEKGESFNEADKVCELFKRCMNLGGKKATEKNFNDALHERSFDNVLFSSHGFLSEKPMHSYMKLYADADTSDSRLTVADIMALKMHETDLVYLAACESAAGRVFRGEGVISLQRAFMIAGVNTIIANLWKVETKTTGELAVRFFDNLKTHHKVEALQQAQLETIIEFKDDYVEHPYFWAPLTLSGAIN